MLPQVGPDAAGAAFLSPSSLTGDRRIYVYLMSGSIDLIEPADAVRFGDTTLFVLDGDEEVGRFARADVLFCSRGEVSPFPFS